MCFTVQEGVCVCVCVCVEGGLKEHALRNLISTYIQIYDFTKLPPAFTAKYPEKLKQLCTLFSSITLPVMP